MDRSTINTIAGLGLIFAIFIGYFIFTADSQEERERKQYLRDSARAEYSKLYKADSSAAAYRQFIIDSVSAALAEMPADTTAASDSLHPGAKKIKDGLFAMPEKGQNEYFLLESELLKVKISARGGFVSSVELKQYKTYSQEPLILFDNDSAFAVNFYGSNNVLYQTSDFYFEPYTDDSRFAGADSIRIAENDSVVFCMRLYPEGADSAEQHERYIEFRYTFRGNNYMLGFDIDFVNMQDVLASNTGSLYFEWTEHLMQQEKNLKTEQNASTVYYKLLKDDPTYLSETDDDEKKFTVPVKWVSFKQQFFSATLIAEEAFKEAEIKVVIPKDTTLSAKHVKTMYTLLTAPYHPVSGHSYPMSLYFGPNHYKTLTAYNLDLERQIPLGWSFPYILGWINRWAVIPVFNWLEGYGMNYGIIILILTIILKVLLFPIAFKTYKSSAKMRVLKPEVEEITKKFPKKEDALKKQQATMALYKKAGVNPMAGCIPLLLQMPILIALFRFFPASIELRQQAFLWADDLSSYDSIVSWSTHIWGLSDVYGNHVSLFTLLMTISTVIYTWLNMQLMGTANQMPAMKWMMYLMPIFFLGFFNNFAAGLSYYYLLANLITFLQMWIFRLMINEDKLHAQIQENKKKPVKKSKFQARLEEMAKQRGYNAPKK